MAIVSDLPYALGRQTTYLSLRHGEGLVSHAGSALLDALPTRPA